MKNPLLLLLVLALSGRFAPPSSIPRDEEADRAAILAHIDQIFHAFMAKDGETLRATHSADWIGYLRTSRTVVSGIDGYMAAVQGALRSPVRISAYELVEAEVRLMGDTALVPYVARMDLVLPDGKAAESRIRVLDVYARRDGEWIQISSQVAEHPDDLRDAYPVPLDPRARGELLAARERVWRAWFTNGEELSALVPEDTLAMDSDGEEWKGQRQVLEAAARFAEGGGKLVDLEFPETEVRVYGRVAIVYSTYRLVVEVDGQRSEERGRATELFVRRDSGWVNPGWHVEASGG